MQNILISKVPLSSQQPLINLVDAILNIKQHNKDTTLEQQVDIMVYRLYELTYAEVQVVDPGFPLSQEAYDNYKIV